MNVIISIMLLSITFLILPIITLVANAVEIDQSFRGVYVGIGRLSSDSDSTDSRTMWIYDLPVTGVTIGLPWSVIEPQDGSYEFRLLKHELDIAIQKNKKVSIGILAAQYSPEWLKNRLTSDGLSGRFNILTGANNCLENTILPRPWDDYYNYRIIRVHRALRRFLGTNPRYYEAVSMIKLGHVAQHGNELRLPDYDGRVVYRNNGSIACELPNANQIWKDLGYTPQLATQGYMRVLNNIAKLFPDKLLAQAILNVDGFPLLDRDSNIIPRNLANTRDLILKNAAQKHGSQFAVQHQGLNPTGYSQRVKQAKCEQGATAGYQTNFYGGRKRGSGCNQNRFDKFVDCNEEGYRRMLNNAIDNGKASYLEIWKVDAEEFKDVVREVDAKIKTAVHTCD